MQLQDDAMHHRLKDLPDTRTGRRALVAIPLDEPHHPLHRHFAATLVRLQQLPIIPGVLTPADQRRVAAQMLMESWLIGMERVDRVALENEDCLMAWQHTERGGDSYCVTLSVRQALSYTVDETTLALDEARQAYPLSAEQRQELHRLQQRQ